MKRKMDGSLVLLFLLLGSGCGSPTTAPSGAVVSLSLSQQSATVERTASLQLAASTTTDQGSVTDVTGTAAWTTSNASIATVANGLVTIVGVGTIQITATSQGKVATADIIGRRRTHVEGTFRLTDSNGRPSITGLGAFIDSQLLISSGSSNPIGLGIPQWDLSIKNAKRALGPGSHTVTLRANMSLGEYDVSAPATTLAILDSDTGEQVGTLTLSLKNGHFRSSGTGDYSPDLLTWTVEIPMLDR